MLLRIPANGLRCASRKDMMNGMYLAHLDDFYQDYLELTGVDTKRLVTSGPPPRSPKDGDLWFNSTDGLFYVYNENAMFWKAR